MIERGVDRDGMCVPEEKLSGIGHVTGRAEHTERSTGLIGL
jgi:hypothetical protein